MRRPTANDRYIIGTYTWAMQQLKNGKHVCRRSWHGRVLVRGKKPHRLTALDKRSIDWELVPLPLKLNEPLVVEAVEPEDKVSGWISWLTSVMVVIAILAVVAYFSYHH